MHMLLGLLTIRSCLQKSRWASMTLASPLVAALAVWLTMFQAAEPHCTVPTILHFAPGCSDATQTISLHFKV